MGAAKPISFPFHPSDGQDGYKASIASLATSIDSLKKVFLPQVFEVLGAPF
ncbi:GL22868 [Drosophila persimilis]|uniref:GL22868 n=1 Tax=Drosophila persimilis TaxID=7234 RepID=B4GZV6_DROPE|nr:GL22868 [Drosophila persimilis]